MTNQHRDYELKPWDWLQIVKLWREGHDTFDIASYFQIHEAIIYNGLPWRRKSFA